MNLRVLFVFLEVLSIGNMGAPLEIFREEDTKGKVGTRGSLDQSVMVLEGGSQ